MQSLKFFDTPCLEDHGDLVSRLRLGISGLTIW